MYCKLGHLVEGHLLYHHLPDLQLELLAHHKLHRLAHITAVVQDARVAHLARLEVELYLQAKEEG